VPAVARVKYRRHRLPRAHVVGTIPAYQDHGAAASAVVWRNVMMNEASEWQSLRKQLLLAREALRLRLHRAGSDTLAAVAAIEREVEHLGRGDGERSCLALRLELMRLQAIVDALDDDGARLP
jgi:hypothetical protein